MTKIVAEVGVNHNGDEDLALELVKVAHQAGVDVVKFQTFSADKLVTGSAEQAKYQKENTGTEESQLSMLSRLELSREAHNRLMLLCKEKKIEFLSTAFDSDSLHFLANDLALTTLKVPSGDLTNAPLLLEHAQTGCDLIVSTGMATLAEVEAALGVIAFGYTGPADADPGVDAFKLAYVSDLGQLALKEKIILLHCTTDYPVSMNDVNLKAMTTMSHAFGLRVGYSDHSEGIIVPVAAVACGAVLIEKHFTLDKTMHGPDHKASLDPSELRQMVRAIRDIEDALGNGVKCPRPSEVENKLIARRSLVTSTSIRAGELYSAKNISVKRPGYGISPYRYWEFLGQRAKRNYQEGEVLVD